jgi:parallel beta-helix repeat protein
MKSVPSSGFFSYRQLDNKNDKQYLSRLRSNLEQEIETLIGRKITIWQDIAKIEWGQHWKQQIAKGLAEAAFFIPVITPGYLRSKACRDEFAAFVKYEANLRRNDLILPLVYVRPDEFDDVATRQNDDVIRIVLERQYIDWEPLRPVGEGRIGYRQNLTVMGKRVRTLLKSVDANPNSRKPRKKTKKKVPKARASTSTGKQGAAPVTPEPREIPKRRTLVVNLLGGTGIYQSISEAIAAAQGGDLISVAAGHYREKIILDKPVEITGEGNLGDVCVETRDGNVLLSTATFGRIKNLALRETGDFIAIWVPAGSIELDSCEITSAAYSCIGIGTAADARIRNCRVHGSSQSGIAFFSKARGLVEECEIYANGNAGVYVGDGVEVVVRANIVRDGRTSGIHFSEGATGLVEDNDVFGHTLAGIAVSEGASPTVRLNRVHDNKDVGIRLDQAANVVIKENEVARNVFSGIQIEGGSNAVVADNEVHDGNHNGMHFIGTVEALVERNHIRGNRFYGMNVRQNSTIKARGNTIENNGLYGIKLSEGASGQFSNNTLKGNTKGPKDFASDTPPDLVWEDSNVID